MMIETLERNEHIAISEAARRAGVSPSGIRFWIRKGHVDAYRTPLGRLVNADSLELYLEERRTSEKEQENG